jgi:hypothetical protein
MSFMVSDTHGDDSVYCGGKCGCKDKPEIMSECRAAGCAAQGHGRCLYRCEDCGRRFCAGHAVQFDDSAVCVDCMIERAAEVAGENFPEKNESGTLQSVRVDVI